MNNFMSQKKQVLLGALVGAVLGFILAVPTYLYLDSYTKSAGDRIMVLCKEQNVMPELDCLKQAMK